MEKLNRWDVISPDGLSIESEVTYSTPEETLTAMNTWVKMYELQGYYSSLVYGRIPYEDITLYCALIKI